MRFIAIFTFLLLTIAAYSQSYADLQSIFFQVNIENIDKRAKDSVVRYSKYYPLSNIPGTVEFYSLEIDTTNRYIKLENGFESGTRGVQTSEIKVIRTEMENDIVIHSSYSIFDTLIRQKDLMIYNFNKIEKELIETKQYDQVFHLSKLDFFKPMVDSVIANFDSHTFAFFDLGLPDKDVAYILIDFSFSKEQVDNNKFLLGNIIDFKWIGNQFIRNGPYYQE